MDFCRLEEDQQLTRGSSYRHFQRRARMAIKDILLPLVGEPSPAAIAAIDKCVAMAGNIGARVTAAAAEAVRSVSSADGLLKAFEAAAIRFGVRNEQRIYRLAAADIPANLA